MKVSAAEQVWQDLPSDEQEAVVTEICNILREEFEHA